MSKIIVDQFQATGGNVFGFPKTGLAKQLLALNAAGTDLEFVARMDPMVSANNPTTNANPGAGVGQLWINRGTGEIFTCVDATTNLNIWVGSRGTVIGGAAVQGIMFQAGLPAKTTNAALGTLWVNTSTGEIFTCTDATLNGNRWVGSQGNSVNLPQGQQLFTAIGANNFVVPANVYSICAVLVGAGAGGHYSWANPSGAGGALAYANAIPVTPGETLVINVPAGGNPGASGGNATITRAGTVLFGAQGGSYGATSGRAAPYAGTIQPKGGQGGLCSPQGYGGGGGAGGYGDSTNGSDAIGGDGGYGSTNLATAGTNGAGGGGNGYQSSTYGFGGGGGVGLNGRTSSGQPGQNPGNSWYNTTGGMGGSGGEQGAGNTNSTQTLNGRTMYHGEGGRYGGGGGGSGSSVNSDANFCKGGQGGARIIWGWNRAFPALNVPDVTTVA